MEANELQLQLFTHLRESLPPHLSMVDELQDLLGLSADSVYRRIRGEKPLTLNELRTICQRYQFSVDQLLQLQTESVIFEAPEITKPAKHFNEYLQAMLSQFKYFNSFDDKLMRYLSKDTPFWYFYLFPAMAAFKTFFWSKTINNQESLSNKQFSIDEFPFTDCFETGQEILKEYARIDCIELWNLESINSTINQIAYYRDTSMFKSAKDYDAVIDSFHQMLDHLQLQAERGVKFMPGATDVSYRAPIQFYINELILGTNTILLTLGGKRVSLVTYSVFNYLITRDERFSGKVFDNFNTLLSRSALVSNTGEKDRNMFFNSLRAKVNGLSK
jgi:hypothetical protein